MKKNKKWLRVKNKKWPRVKDVARAVLRTVGDRPEEFFAVYDGATAYLRVAQAVDVVYREAFEYMASGDRAVVKGDRLVRIGEKGRVPIWAVKDSSSHRAFVASAMPATPPPPKKPTLTFVKAQEEVTGPQQIANINVVVEEALGEKEQSQSEVSALLSAALHEILQLPPNSLDLVELVSEIRGRVRDADVSSARTPSELTVAVLQRLRDQVSSYDGSTARIVLSDIDAELRRLAKER